MHRTHRPLEQFLTPPPPLRPLPGKKRRFWAPADTAVVFEKVAHSFRTCKAEDANMKDTEKDIPETDIGETEAAEGEDIGGDLRQPANGTIQTVPLAATAPARTTADETETPIVTCHSNAVAAPYASTSPQIPVPTSTAANLELGRLLVNQSTVALLAMYQQQLSNSLMVGHQQPPQTVATSGIFGQNNLLQHAVILQSLKQNTTNLSGHSDAKPAGKDNDSGRKQGSTWFIMLQSTKVENFLAIHRTREGVMRRSTVFSCMPRKHA